MSSIIFDCFPFKELIMEFEMYDRYGEKYQNYLKIIDGSKITITINGRRI